MKQNVIVLSVNPYSMNNNGNITEGTSIRYLPLDNLSPVREDNNLGTRPAKDNLPYDWRHKFPSAPALYEADLAMRVGSDGKPAMYIKEIAYLSDVSLTVKDSKAITK